MVPNTADATNGSLTSPRPSSSARTQMSPSELAQTLVGFGNGHREPAEFRKLVPALGQASVRVSERRFSHRRTVPASDIFPGAVGQHVLVVVENVFAHSPSTALERMLRWISLLPPAIV